MLEISENYIYVLKKFFLSILDSYNEEEVILVWEDRKDGGLAIPLRNLPQHNISETLTMQLRTEYMSGKLLLSFVP
jgi:hypothetical protein